MIFLSHCQITSSKREIIIGEVHKISLPSVTTSSGVHLKISDIPDQITNSMDTFYICSSCGHVYWKGSHWDKVKEKCSNLQ
uniref:Mut7-C RNAse domain-containing protein n=2 Tax=Lepeophtheirus salmonis TaxID=72036 RepID=A0A0K2VH84_LEPSM